MCHRQSAGDPLVPPCCSAAAASIDDRHMRRSNPYLLMSVHAGLRTNRSNRLNGRITPSRTA